VAVSWASFNSSSIEFGIPKSLLSMTRRSSRSKWSETLLRYWIFMSYQKPQMLQEQAVHCMNFVSWDIDEFWLYRNIQDPMPRSLSQVRRTQRNNILCKWSICASPSSSLHYLPEQPCQTYKSNRVTIIHDLMYHWWSHNFSHYLWWCCLWRENTS